MRTFLVLIVVAASILGMTHTAAAQKSVRELAFSFIQEGQPFPDLVLPDLKTGQPRSITEFRGKKVLLHVFASW